MYPSQPPRGVSTRVHCSPDSCIEHKAAQSIPRVRHPVPVPPKSQMLVHLGTMSSSFPQCHQFCPSMPLPVFISEVVLTLNALNNRSSTEPISIRDAYMSIYSINTPQTCAQSAIVSHQGNCCSSPNSKPSHMIETKSYDQVNALQHATEVAAYCHNPQTPSEVGDPQSRICSKSHHKVECRSTCSPGLQQPRSSFALVFKSTRCNSRLKRTSSPSSQVQ